MKHRHDIRHIFLELKEHIPYTIFSVAVGMIALGILTFASGIYGAGDISNPSKGLFHVFHPIHLLFSAVATTAMFWRHDKNFLKALIIGFIGSLGFCGMSDVFIPYIAGFLLGVKMHLHICALEHPHIILPFVAIGIFAGFMMPSRTQKTTIFSHSAHVLVSSMASILYLIGYGLTAWINVAGMVFIYTVLAVIIPCCTSDIVFPLLFTKKTNR